MKHESLFLEPLPSKEHYCALSAPSFFASNSQATDCWIHTVHVRAIKPFVASSHEYLLITTEGSRLASNYHLSHRIRLTTEMRHIANKKMTDFHPDNCKTLHKTYSITILSYSHVSNRWECFSRIGLLVACVTLERKFAAKVFFTDIHIRLGFFVDFWKLTKRAVRFLAFFLINSCQTCHW